jgi:uncharacterized hydrophobic protein (TIGR00271 family)
MAIEIPLDSSSPDSRITAPAVVQAYDKVQDLERHLESISKLSVDFLALLSTSTVIATFGLFENSAAVIIGAMIIAPLMRPLTGLSLGLLTADLLLLKRAALTLLAGSVLGALIAYTMALILQQIEFTPEILARTKPTLLDLGIAVFAGGLGAYCQSKKQLADSLGGVAIAVALVPPLSVVGIGLALNEPEIWQGAGLLYLTNLVGITIAGAVVFLAMGYAQLRRAKRGLMISAALLGLLTTPLALSMNEMILENRLSGKVRQILQEKTYTFKDVRVRDVEIRKYRRPLVAIATVFTDQQIRPKQVSMVQDFLAKELGLPLELRIKVVPLTEITAKSPEMPSQ